MDTEKDGGEQGNSENIGQHDRQWYQHTCSQAIAKCSVGFRAKESFTEGFERLTMR